MTQNATAPLAGETRHGFAVRRVTPLPEIAATAYEAEHLTSGARLLHLHAPADPENLFVIGLRTPPADDTGLPHILEHTVLCGSRRYPVKDPFVELLKTSLATFLNAMTYPDKTVYPCASQNERDFFNLASVYADAVFHPLITEAHFSQEGHHLELAQPGDLAAPLIRKGIVYNEMKGAFSDLDGTLDRWLVPGLCPDNAYGRESGGDPQAIPQLTYAQFKRFHETYYHPANSYIFIYGDLPTDKHLEFLNREGLAGFSRIEIDTAIAPQPRWREPRRLTKPYPVDEQEELANKTAAVAAWLAGDINDRERTLALTLLGHYLLGNAASPLRKALIDSRLGEELTHAGYFAYQRDTFFAVGLKGTEADRAEPMLELIRQVVATECDRGLNAAKLDAAFHRLELAAREIASRYPLVLMDRVYNSWIYGADPLANLRQRAELAALRERCARQPAYLTDLLRAVVLDNPHRLLLTCVPDRSENARRQQAETEELAARKAQLNPTELAELDRQAQALTAAQDEPNSPKALATLPKLRTGDIPPEPRELPTVVQTALGRPFLHTDLPAGGLTYLQLAFSLQGLDEDLYPLLPVFIQAVRKMGAAGLNYAAMAEREAACCAGVGLSLAVGGTVSDPGLVTPRLIVGVHGLEERLPQMLGVLADRLLRADFGDRARLKDVILQERTHWRADVAPHGNQLAMLRAARGLSRNCALAECCHGLSALRVYERLGDRFDAEADELIAKFERIRRQLLARSRVAASFVGGAASAAQTQAWYADTLSALVDTPALAPVSSAAVLKESPREGVAAPLDVAFVAQALPAPAAADPVAPALLLLGLQLGFGHLWNEIRVKGGAYGAAAAYLADTGTFIFSSYRDPRIGPTLQAFAATRDHIAHELDLSPAGLEQSIIGTFKTLDRPIRQGQAVGLALGRFLSGETPVFRREFRARLLGLKAAAVRAAGEQLLADLKRAPVCVLASRERLEAENRAELGLKIENLV